MPPDFSGRNAQNCEDVEMRYAIFSDVHAYPAALEKVLADADSLSADVRICLGDIVGYGPDPVGAVKLCRDACDLSVAGNHDAAVARQISTMFFIPRAQTAVARHQELLSDEDVAWLAALPMHVDREDFLGAHGEIHRRAGTVEAGFGYVLSDWDAFKTIDALPEGKTLAFVGHTHAACVWRQVRDEEPWLLQPKDMTLEPGVRYVINVGSVGYPRYHHETNYVIYDSEARSVQFRHLAFDFNDYCGKMDGAGIDPPLWIPDTKK